MNDDGRVAILSEENVEKMKKELVNIEKRKLKLNTIPFSLTCILHKNYVLANPANEEELIIETQLTVVLDSSYQIVSLFKHGGPVFAYSSTIQECIALTRQSK